MKIIDVEDLLVALEDFCAIGGTGSKVDQMKHLAACLYQDLQDILEFGKPSGTV